MHHNVFKIICILGVILMGMTALGMIRGLDEVIGTRILVSLAIILIILRAVQAISTYKERETDKY